MSEVKRTIRGDVIFFYDTGLNQNSNIGTKMKAHNKFTFISDVSVDSNNILKATNMEIENIKMGLNHRITEDDNGDLVIQRKIDSVWITKFKIG
tara:strand:- start:2289 stop:2570 length:282 start_codon:yes stop_codon:yes gene_type:complete